jgi:para-aminobenzoate synthetase component 1
MGQRLQELPYTPDTASIFNQLASWHWAVFLDSGSGNGRQGRYDIIAAEPFVTLVTRGDRTKITSRQGSIFSTDDPFELLRAWLQPTETKSGDLPFSGGALGYFSYDLGRRIERLPVLAADDEQLPEMAVGIYDWALVVDHEEQRSWLVAAGRDPEAARRWEELVALFRQIEPMELEQELPPFSVRGAVQSSLSYAQYAAGFGKIARYIREGDCYQVNYAQRFEVDCDGDTWTAYRHFREINPAPFSAYLNLPFLKVLSASPERFIQVTDRQIITQPIKGTAPRSADPVTDRKLAEALENSLKDQAENVMIVDLLRNDLSKNSELFSVKVPRLFELQSFATVHHLVSTITGRLNAGKDAIDLLRGCFPGGSITGTPKIRAMEIIEELEMHRRGIYCGSIGYIGFNGDMDTSIVIRTLSIKDGKMRYWAGGGIVVDSRLEGEYQESLDKARAMRDLVDVCR